jgi:hypothetical protein
LLNYFSTFPQVTTTYNLWNSSWKPTCGLKLIFFYLTGPVSVIFLLFPVGYFTELCSIFGITVERLMYLFHIIFWFFSSLHPDMKYITFHSEDTPWRVVELNDYAGNLLYLLLTDCLKQFSSVERPLLLSEGHFFFGMFSLHMYCPLLFNSRIFLRDFKRHCFPGLQKKALFSLWA